VNKAAHVRPLAEQPPESDRIFADQRPPADFEFGVETAKVFDDMVERSVPFYSEIQRMMVELAGDFATESSSLYDLGCATGTTLAVLDAPLPAGVTFIGVDNSASMLAKAEEKLKALGTARNWRLVNSDLNELPPIENASVVLLCLTLQFVRPLRRERIMRQICDGMLPQGGLILVEKVTATDSRVNRLFINHYYDMKRRHGYSDLEIAQKREALENVMIPYRLDENVELLRNAGFATVEPFFTWYNFCGLLAIK